MITVTHFWDTADGNGKLKKIPIPLMSDDHVLKTHYLLRESIFLMKERLGVGGNIRTRNKIFNHRSKEWIEMWIERFDEAIVNRKLTPKPISKHEYLHDYREKLKKRSGYFRRQHKTGLGNL